jgi:hypothetical protein
MNESDYDFWWPGPAATPCHRWEMIPIFDVDGYLPRLCLVPVRGVEPRLYRPLEHPGLFLRLADLDATQEGVLDFVSRYGPLGDGLLVRDPESPSGENMLVEPLVFWQFHAARIHALTNLWGYASAGDRAALAEFVRWEGAAVAIRWPAADRWFALFDERVRGTTTWSVEEYRGPDGTSLVKRGDLIVPAQLFVQRRLDAQLRSGQAHPRLVWSTRHGRPELVNSPGSLLDALYLQFAIATANPDGGFQISRCLRCGKRIELAPGVNRADRTTCSDSCRALLYRQRKERARQLHAEGMKLKEIAQELFTDIARVKKWVANAKG